jgi:hypothetical protein
MDDGTEQVGPSPLLRIMSVIVIGAMILGSGSAIVALGSGEARTGLVLAVVAIGIVLFAVARRTRRDSARDGDVTDGGP